MAAAGVPMRTLQEWMGHRDFKTTLIYADYAPSAHEGEMVERAFAWAQSWYQSERKCRGTQMTSKPLETCRNPNLSGTPSARLRALWP